MEITRQVILDLLPLYLANEASADTRALIEEYLETDPELADIAKRSAELQLPKVIPVPLTKEDKMEAYKEAKRSIRRHTMIWAVAISVGILCALGLAISAFLLLSGFFISV